LGHARGPAGRKILLHKLLRLNNTQWPDPTATAAVLLSSVTIWPHSSPAYVSGSSKASWHERVFREHIDSLADRARNTLRADMSGEILRLQKLNTTSSAISVAGLRRSALPMI